jgi:hypothetical protein
LLRKHLKLNADTLEKDKIIGDIANAEDAANRGDGKGVIQFLAKAGKVALEVTTKIGTEVAIKAIQGAV